MTLTESHAMCPAASVSGLEVARTEAGYFAIEQIARDRVEDCSRRRGRSLAGAGERFASDVGSEA